MRPEGWDNIKESILEELDGMSRYCCDDCGDKILEVCADAIFEELKNHRVIYKDAGIVSLGSYGTFETDKPGYLVFIPGEE